MGLYFLQTYNLLSIPLCHSRVPLCHSRESGNLYFLFAFVGGGFLSACVLAQVDIRPVLIAGSINQAPTLTGGTPAPTLTGGTHVLRFRAYVIHPASFPISLCHCEHRFRCVAIPSNPSFAFLILFSLLTTIHYSLTTNFNIAVI